MNDAEWQENYDELFDRIQRMKRAELHINCRCVLVRIDICDWCGCESLDGKLHPRCKTVKELLAGKETQ